LQAFFARFIEELSAELDIPASEAADVVEDALDEGADIATGDAECTDCDAAEVGDAVDALIEAVDEADADAEPVVAKSAAALRRENARLRAKLARQADNDWLSKQVSAKRLTPGGKARGHGGAGQGPRQRQEREPDTAAAIRSHDRGAARASGQRTSIKAAGMSQAGIQFSPANGAGIDPATLARMKSYAGME
jgi:hypothetical protein